MTCHQCGKGMGDIVEYVQHVLYDCASEGDCEGEHTHAGQTTEGRSVAC